MRTRLVCVSVAACFVAMTPLALADVTLKVTTTPAGGSFAPRNVVAVWVETANGTFVKTIDRHAAVRKVDLVAWTQKAGANDADAVSGATRQDHSMPLNITWNLKDRTNAVVPDGTYTIRMELSDSNTSTTTPNHEGTFTFVKGASPQLQSGLTNNGFTNVSIDFKPVVNTCNNGVVDPGEACDPAVAGSCPSTCAASTDACKPNVLVGSAATCDAACMVEPITACTNDDGCCADGCTPDNDNDCNDNNVSGGCATGASPGVALALLLGLVLGVRGLSGRGARRNPR